MPNGNCALIMLRSKTDSDGVRYFEYCPTLTAPIITLRWQGDVILAAPDLAQFLLAKKYARNLTQAECDAVNEGAEELPDEPPAEAARGERQPETPAGDEKPPAEKTPPEEEVKEPAGDEKPADEPPAETAPADEAEETWDGDEAVPEAETRTAKGGRKPKGQK